LIDLSRVQAGRILQGLVSFCPQSIHDNIVCEFLEFGWPVGFTRETLPIFTARTHRGALDFPEAVTRYLRKECSLGRVAGPFTEPPFHDGFVVSPDKLMMSALSTLKKDLRMTLRTAYSAGSYSNL
ncbi:hypothetical protein QZH41_011483, partial [Actinostola sp. cb2023]